MKKWQIIVALSLFILMMEACESEMMSYEGKPGVYFHVQVTPPSGYGAKEVWERVDTSKILFVKTLAEEMEVELPVRIMGYAADYDRYFQITVVDTATTAQVDVDYTPIATRYLIPADSVETTVRFQVKRTPMLADTTLQITLDLVPTHDFDLPMNKWRKLTSDYSEDRLINIVRHVVRFNDGIYKPKQWTDNYFGTYSAKKMRLILQVSGKLITDFDVYMTGGQKTAIAIKVDAYLKAEEAAGRTIYEDGVDKDGNKIKMKMGVNVTN